MKYLLTTVCALVIAGSSFGQNAIQQHFSELESREDLTHVTISGKMFEMMMEVDSDNPEVQEMLEAFAGVQGIEAYGSESEGNPGFVAEALNQLGDEFEELITVEDQDTKATVLIVEENGVVTELVAIGESNEGWGIATIWGEVDLTYVAQMMSELDVNGFKQVEKERFDMSAAITIYPNPSAKNGNLTYNVPEELVNGTFGVFDGRGKLITSGQIKATSGQVSLKGLSKANYMIKFENQEGEGFTKQFLVQ